MLSFSSVEFGTMVENKEVNGNRSRNVVIIFWVCLSKSFFWSLPFYFLIELDPLMVAKELGIDKF